MEYEIYAIDFNDIRTSISIAVQNTDNQQIVRKAFCPNEKQQLKDWLSGFNLSYDEIDSEWSDADAQEYENSLTPPAMTVAEFKAEANTVVSNVIENTAKSRGYDSSLSISTYATSKNPQWKAEAECFIDWRDAVWGFCLEQFELIESGSIPVPAFEDIRQALPAIQWPEQE